MKLPDKFLEELRQRTLLPELIGKTVKLTRAGRQSKGCCPFHEEKSPSFYVYEDGYHCFGCGAHGDAISFVMETRSLSFKQAVEMLATEVGIQIPDLEVVPTFVLSSPGPVDRPPIDNETGLASDAVESILGTAARLLVRNNHMSAASILANSGGSVILWSQDNWNGGSDEYRFEIRIPADVYFDLQNRDVLETQIDQALSTAMEPLRDSMTVKITTDLEHDREWRQKVKYHTTGQGISNQGRIRSDNIATKQYDGLLFRSKPEVLFYNALKRSGVPFAPLAVVLNGGIPKKRVEPDFILFKEELTMIVEIDGDLYHGESPAAAHARLKFLTEEGIILERIDAAECDTREKATESVGRVLRTLGKHRKAR